MNIRRIIREEMDDLDWIKDVVNIKLGKDENWILVNDIDRESISEGHEIQKYLFDLGYSWGTGDLKNHLKDFCIYTIYHYGNIKDDEHIYYGDGCRSAEVRISDKDIKSGEHMIYYWSDLKPKTIKEEMDDLQWIRDVEPPSFDSLVGKALYFEPYIDNMVDLKRILEVLSGMGFTYGPWANDASFDDEDLEIVGLYLDPRNNNIVYTDFISEDYEEHISEWAEKPVEVLDGWLTLGGLI